MFGGWGAGRGAHTGGHRPAGRLGASQYRETQALASSLPRNPAAWRAGGVPANRALRCGLSLSLARDSTPQGHSCREVRQDRPPGARPRARRGPCPSAARSPADASDAGPARASCSAAGLSRRVLVGPAAVCVFASLGGPAFPNSRARHASSGVCVCARMGVGWAHVHVCANTCAVHVCVSL